MDSSSFEVLANPPPVGQGGSAIMRRTVQPRIVTRTGPLSAVVTALIAVRAEDRRTERRVVAFRAVVAIGLTAALTCTAAALLTGRPYLLLGFPFGIFLAAFAIRGFLTEAQRDLDDRRLSHALGILRNLTPDVDPARRVQLFLDLREPYQLQRLPATLEKTYTGRHRFPWLQITLPLAVGARLDIRIVAKGTIAETMSLSPAGRVRLDREEQWQETLEIRVTRDAPGGWTTKPNPPRFPKDVSLDGLESEGRKAVLRASAPKFTKVVKKTVLTDGSSRRLRWEKVIEVLAWTLNQLEWDYGQEPPARPEPPAPMPSGMA